MQVFIVGSVWHTACVLDKRRFNKQRLECKQLLAAISGKSKAYVNHPCAIQYRQHVDWLKTYALCLEMYSVGIWEKARELSDKCESMRPDFHTNEYFNQMKRRLYTKDDMHYSQWRELGKSYENWYWIDNKWKVYHNGKVVKHDK